MTKACIVPLGLALAACTVTAKTQTKFSASNPVSKTEQGTWTNQAIEVENANGDVVVQSVSGLTQITVTTVPFSFADTQADAQQALNDVTGSIAIDESAGLVYVHCSKASKSYGSAGNGTTGCDNFTVQVPAAGIGLKATAHNGQIQANGVITAAQAQSVTIHSDNGSVSASLNPGQGSSLEASSANGEVTLALPGSFAADKVTMSSGNGTVTVQGFASDFTATSTSRGMAGAGAASVTATTDNGDVLVKAQ